MSHARRPIAPIAPMIAWLGALPASAADPVAPAKAGAEKATPEATAPPAKTAGVANAKVIPAAITALRKEYMGFVKDPKATLREKSDYFKENPAEVTPDAILKALEGSITGDAALQAYVKWQLLSGVEG
jgi:hypothetical protein